MILFLRHFQMNMMSYGDPHQANYMMPNAYNQQQGME